MLPFLASSPPSKSFCCAGNGKLMFCHSPMYSCYKHSPGAPFPPEPKIADAAQPTSTLASASKSLQTMSIGVGWFEIHFCYSGWFRNMKVGFGLAGGKGFGFSSKMEAREESLKFSA